MYASHFGLTAEPFSLKPDPDFLYLSPAHAEALAAIKVGLLGKRGVMVLSGEVGTGKTTLVYALLGALDDDMRTAYVANTATGFDGVLRLALADFGVTPSSHARVDMLMALNDMLRNCAERGVGATLIVDEAQNLDSEAFEQLRLLSSYESWMQIVLVGQPELEARLRQPALRALAERVAVHYRLTPLGARDSRAYLEHRLRCVGGSPNLFERAARGLLLGAAAGLPRRINILCDNALLFAYGRGDPRVTRAVAQLAVAGRALLQGEAPPEPARPLVVSAPHRAPGAALALGGAVLVAALAVVGLRAPAWLSDPGAANAPPALEAPVAVASAPGRSAHAHEERAAPGSARTHVDPFAQAASARPEPFEEAGDTPGEEPSRGVSIGSQVEAASPDEPAADGDQSASTASLGAPAGDRADAPVTAEEVASGFVAEAARAFAGGPAAPAADRAAPRETRKRFRSVRVEPGASLESLARAVYGDVDSATLKRILNANPQVADPNLILAGDLLRFPEAAPEQSEAEKGASQ
jgi:general secretion pathway protein A